MVWYWLIFNEAVYDTDRELVWILPGGQVARRWNKWQQVDVTTDGWIYGKHVSYFGIWQPPPEELRTVPELSTVPVPRPAPPDEEGTWY